MKNNTLFVIILLFCTATLSAQNAPNITLTVKDSTTSEPIGYATVELLSPTDSTLISGITNDNGFIAIPAQANTAKLRISFIGYKTFVAPITALDMGVITLAEDATMLAGVSVEGATRITKIDRDVYLITKELKAGAATARELLGKLNGVTYNFYDQSISVNGNSNVLILVDGIEKDQNMAKTLSPDRIERVEVIKDPVGKYAADGYKAVINIITKQDFSGINITINTNPMFNFFNKGIPCPFIQENSSLNILYTYKKLNIYASYWNYYSDLYIPFAQENRYGDLTVKSSEMDYNNPNLNSFNHYNSVTLGGDYLLKEGNTIALEVNYSTNYGKQAIVSDLTTFQNNVETDKSFSYLHSGNTGDALQATLTYKGKWSEKSSFDADFRYRHSAPTNFSTYEQGEAFSESKNRQTENFYRINLNYTYQISKKISMDFGYGVIYTDYSLNQNNTTLKQQQLRNRPSVYFSYAPIQKLSFKVGAMVEFYNQKFTGIEPKSQVGVLPFANVMYRHSDKFSITAKYNSYPSYTDISSLNTFATQQDSLTWSIGNPDLKPSNFQRVSIDFNFLKYFTVSPFFDFDASNFQQYSYKNGEKYYQSQVNCDFKSVGANVSFTIPFLKQTLFWQNDLQLRQTWLSYNGLKNNLFAYTFNSYLFYSIKKWDAMVGAGIQKGISKWPALQGYNQSNNDIFMIMIQKNLFKKKLSITLMYMPPIPGGKFFKYEQEQMTQMPNYYSFNSAGLQLLKNLMMLQINFNFNQGKQVKVTKSSLDNDSNTKQKGGGIGL